MAEMRHKRVVVFIGVAGCLAALVCSPPLAERLLALEPLHRQDTAPLWTLSILLLAISAYVTFGKARVRQPLAALMLPLLGFMFVEAVARTYVRAMSIEHRKHLILLARRTYRDQMAYQPHPFLQFTGRPNASIQGTEFNAEMPRFNELGFSGPMVLKTKAPDTIRIACLGGSTTGDGYPFELERDLRRRTGQSHQFEAMSFGLGWYTSTHSLVNFVLNAQDYSPDYVVFLHAINDARGHGFVGGVRSDYTHLCKPFEYPWIPDAYLIRASVIYRYVQYKITKSPDWSFLDTAVVRQGEKKKGDPYADPADLEPYERNIRTIIDLALVRGITPVLATQPHSTDPATHAHLYEKGFDRCNDAVRRLAEVYRLSHPDRVLLVDLDTRFTGQNELFVDIVHMNDRGVELKAQNIANTIFSHLQQSTEVTSIGASVADEFESKQTN